MTDEPRDYHRTKRATLRPPDDVKAEAQAVLAANGWTMNEFLVACLVLVAKDSAAMLKRLGEFRPTTKPGRPRKAQPTE